jgi:hypothetical protein
VSQQPRPPLQHWPVQVLDPRFGFVWYCQRGIMVAQLVVDHGTAEAAHAYHDLEDRVLAHRGEEVERAGGLYVIHDWRGVHTYDAETRKVWLARMRRRKPGYLRGSTVVVTEASSLLRMGVQAVNMMASLNLGLVSRITLSEDLSHALAEEGVRPPPQGASFPGPD